MKQCSRWLYGLILVVCLSVVVDAPRIVAKATTTKPTSADQSAPASSTPVRLVIPRIGLDTTIEAIGKTESGEIGVPQAAENVAWYSQGITPGEAGNAVISGHVDTKAGRAVFWRLREMAVGDHITVFDKTGVERTFEVIERTLYPYNEAPIHKIFGFDLERDLNLITCAGRWNPQTRNYSQRLVVYTRLVSETSNHE